MQRWCAGRFGRWLGIVGFLGGKVAGVSAMVFVTQQVFPPADTPLFHFNYQGAQGTSIHQTSRDLAVVEDWLAARPDVAAVTATMGQGVSRFVLTYTPAKPAPTYGQLAIRARDVDAIPALRDDLAAFARDALPWAETRVPQIIYSPPVGADVEVRLSGPDPNVLRALAGDALCVLEAAPLLQTPRIDWREREFTARPVHAHDRAQSLGITRADVTAALSLAIDGIPVGRLREGERDIPFLVRSPRAGHGARLTDQIVFPPATGA